MKALWIVLGAYTTVWGAWLLSPWWTVFSDGAHLYSQMSHFMPEWGWGLHALVVGLSILAGVLYRWPRALWWGRVSSTYHWLLIAGFYLLGDWKNTGWLTSLCIVLAIQVMWKITPRTAEVHPLD